MAVDIVVGGFWGDEGKGKIISYLVKKRKPTIVARGGVGPNAGHTIVVDGKVYKLRMVPSAIGGKEVEKFLIGPGVLVNPEVFLQEISTTNIENRAFLDPQCGIISDKHRKVDSTDPHLTKKIGTTGSGSGPANEERVRRTLTLAKDIDDLQPYLIDVPGEIHEALSKGDSVLLEGTQATYLSLFHGTYPFVTTKDVTASAICSDVGIGPTVVTDVIIVFKAYVTRVGKGFLPDELAEEETINRGWSEYGTVTKRLRRAAPFNVELAKRSIQLNSATRVAITKLDVLFPLDRGKTNFDELTEEAKNWVYKTEKDLGMKIHFIGTGPADVEIIDRE
ncbi:MAG: adenylosuccinate synthetase [Candidatus Heimdallarchaeota archaeon]|nr:adenylosuccinate synthetase [Candidatus Heimdallarchaeota archaeon]